LLRLGEQDHHGETQADGGGYQHGTQDDEKHFPPAFFEVNRKHFPIVKEKHKHQDEVYRGEKQDSAEMHMTLHVLLDLRKEKRVAEKGGDGEDDMKAHADAQREQQNRPQ
jgi:hypothetical protein